MTITKERLLKIQHWREIYGADSNVMLPAEEAAELARIALASLEAEPAGYHVIKECGKVGCSVARLEEAEKTRDFWNKKWTIRPYFYSAAPAPVVPEEIPKGLAGQIVSLLAHNIGDKFLAQKIWNACRAAMLQGVEQPQNTRQNIPENIPDGNSPAIPDDWVMVPKEPTQAMIKAWLSEVDNFRGHAAGYKAALAAAPQREVK